MLVKHLLAGIHLQAASACNPFHLNYHPVHAQQSARYFYPGSKALTQDERG